MPTTSTFHTATVRSRRKESSKGSLGVKAPTISDLLTKAKPVTLEAYKVNPEGKTQKTFKFTKKLVQRFREKFKELKWKEAKIRWTNDFSPEKSTVSLSMDEKQLRIEKTKLELRAKRDKLMQKLYKRPDPITEFGSIATTSVKKSDSLEPSIRGGSPEPSFVTLTQF